MTIPLPLFPLGAVVFPGQLLPLHVFEERYRQLVAHLSAQAGPAGRRFGVVAIRLDREVGADGIESLHEVGTVTVLTEVAPYPDGRVDVVATAVGRFLLRRVDSSEPWLTGEVDLLDEGWDDAGDPATAVAAAGALLHYGRYRETLASLGRTVPDEQGWPAAVRAGTRPAELSYLLAQAMLLDPGEQQALLAAPDAGSRLRQEVAVLRREQAVASEVRAVPVLGLTRAGYGVN